MTSHSHIADAAPRNWVEAFSPPWFLPYAQLMRLDRPVGWWLLLLPCWWGLALAQVSMGGGLINLWHAFLFFAGAVVMRGAGCVINDLVDRDFDAKVERTKNRPLASGRASVRNALFFLALLLFLGLAVILQFNWFTVMLGFASVPIIAVYPFMKRFTYWPQVVLGLAFNWGALVGFSAAAGSLQPAAYALYCAGLLWTLAYDTIYAHQDKEDDILIGVKSTALKLGASTPQWLFWFFAAALILLSAAAVLAGAGWPSFVGIALAAFHGLWQLRTFEADNSAQCLKLFKSNRTFGLLVFTGFLIDGVLR